MTGAGTAADPYIVTTWEEFLSVADSTSVYIKCADNCVWDFNEIEPEGIQDIDISFANWDGNNVELRNMAFVNPLSSVKHYGLNFIGNGASLCEMKNVNFINAYINNKFSTLTSHDAAFIFFTGYFHIKNCKFSAYVQRGLIFSSVITGTLSSESNFLRFMECSFNFDCFDSSYFYHADVTNRGSIFQNCKINFGGETSSNYSGFASNTYSKPHFYNCKITGNVPFKLWYFDSTTSVIDVYVTFTGDITITSAADNVLINSTKYDNQTQIPATFKQATATQMTDVSYLQSIGFPVVEV